MGNNYWCCSEDAIALDLCENDSIGRLLVDSDKFDGEHRPVEIRRTGDNEGSVKLPVMDTMKGSGTYTLVLANCDDFGTDVIVDGEYIWRSKAGYLPGDLFDEWHFLMFLTLCYFGFLFWFARSMSNHKDSTIDIQKWILGTLALAVVEIFFKTADYLEWNSKGTRVDAVMYICKYCRYQLFALDQKHQSMFHVISIFYSYCSR